ncbi:hypothetical protein DW933_02290 [Lachnospira eligens]|uniref:Bacillus phage SPbeta YonK domain-containing protein n=2 Tax=Lachnospira eligens TaxID=39485 RepID=A0A415ME86_9FIRM|nr:hypothetical protein DW933_02290 [Lachnospira eligens]RHL71176.1 hypothetical protein DW007_03250 [Lachnospira eligens]
MRKENKGMSNFSYKKTTTTSMKVAGIIDTDNMTIDVDGEVKKLATLFADFNGGGVELNVKIKEEDELDEPSESEE